MPADSDPLGHPTIEVRIRDLGQLFNSLDPSPFTERDLDDDAEAYIVSWAREVDIGVPFRIVVHLPASEAEKAQQRGLESAIGNYFAYRAGMLSARHAEIGRPILRNPDGRDHVSLRRNGSTPSIAYLRASK